MALKFAANISFMFKEQENLLDRFSYAAKAGFKAVEFGFLYEIPIHEIVEAKETANIEVVHINAFKGDTNGLTSLPGHEEEFKQCIELSVKYASALRCKRIHALAGAFPDDQPVSSKLREEYEETYITNLSYAADRLQKEGMVLLIEPITTIANYFLTSTRQAIDIIKTVNHKNLKLQLDLYHAQRTHGNLTQTLTDYMPYIGHIQISQVPSRNEPDCDGEINYPFIFHHIAKLEYKGWIGCEYNPRGITEDGLGWLAPYQIN